MNDAAGPPPIPAVPGASGSGKTTTGSPSVDRSFAIMVMGVQGSGKSTIGSLLAQRLGVAFVDGDALHSPENIARMAAGVALTDDDRMPWLRQVAGVLARGRDGGIVVVCSALKRSYRDLIRSEVPELFVVDPEGPIELVAARISERRHEYMPPELLQSQYDALEPLQPDERGIIVDISHSPAEMVETITAAIDGEQGSSAAEA